MYHYTESGIQNVWLRNGYAEHKTQYGAAVSIRDVDGLHKAIGIALTRRPRLTGAQLRFLRKEMQMSQAAFATLVGTSEQTVSLWERRGHMPKPVDRLVKLVFAEHVGGNVQIRAMIERLNDTDAVAGDRISLEESGRGWKEAA